MTLGGILNDGINVPLHTLPFLGSWHIICPCCGQQEDLQYVPHTSSQLQLHKLGSYASYNSVMRWNNVPALKETDLSGYPILTAISSVKALYIQPLLHSTEVTNLTALYNTETLRLPILIKSDACLQILNNASYCMLQLSYLLQLLPAQMLPLIKDITYPDQTWKIFVFMFL